MAESALGKSMEVKSSPFKSLFVPPRSECESDEDRLPLTSPSILHPPGNDPLGYESSSERWSPVQSIEKILLSVMSMLAEPNTESPANVDAAKMWREDRPAFKKKSCLSVRKSLDMV